MEYNPIFKSFDNLEILRQFDGVNNYFNCTGCNNIIYYRHEFIKDNKLLSRIIDKNDNVILDVEKINDQICFYEDPRFINENEISCTKVYTNPNGIGGNVHPILYNIKEHKVYSYNISKGPWEKNWIFYNNYIFYKLNPFVVYDRDENIIYNKIFNFSYWQSTFGDLRLSCNPFIVNDKYYMLFHSRCYYSNSPNPSYINGLIMLNNDLIPIGYYKNPFNIDKMINDPTELMTSLYNWKKSIGYPAIYCKLHYFTSVVVDDNNLYLYGGKHDCQAIKVTISKEEFLNKLSKEEFIKF